MNFSKQSEYFIKKLNVKSSIPVEKNKNISKMLFNLINDANAIAKDIPIEPKLGCIHSVNDIPKPSSFTSKFLPDMIRNSIYDNSSSYIMYNYLLDNRMIRINMIFNEENIELKMTKYKEYIRTILLWLMIATNFSSNACTNRLTIYIYMTDYKKVLPNSSIDTIGINNINSGYSDVCRRDSEIVIYRKEEWLKVLIHETFHNLGLEFSQMNISDFQNKISKLFPIESELALYETWAESWALIMNTGICAYMALDYNKNEKDFVLYYEYLILNEKKFTCFQVVKILSHMNLTYSMLIDPRMKDQVNKLYKENTNVFAYFIVKLLLIFDHGRFINWCKKNNPHLIRFMQSQKNITSLFYFIKGMYKKDELLKAIKEMEVFYRKQGSSKFKKTLRMSLCELI